MLERLTSWVGRFLAWLFALGFVLPAFALSASYRVQAPAAKAVYHDALKVQPGAIPATSLSVAPVRSHEIEALRDQNSLAFGKSLAIGIGREVANLPAAGSASLQWTPVPGGAVAHWHVSSSGAEAIRVGLDVARLAPGVELRFSGNGGSVVYGPFTGTEVSLALGEVYWSPVLEGDVATIEVFSPGATAPGLAAGVRVVGVSHLFVSPMNPRVETLAKSAGFCQVDFVCLSAFDNALANAGKATARMTATDGSGSSGLCTGTLVNSISATAQPYFFTANHCFNPSGRGSQASASSVTTLWFYERSACGGGSVGSLQVGGGARLLYADAASDVMLLRLNNPPPPGAVYSGWDAATVPLGTRFWAVHHPEGDVKKVSLGAMGGYVADLNGSAGNVLMNVLWDSTATGIVERGSSGSAVFSAVGSPAQEYRVRGALFGGPSSCTASGVALRDYYSRLDTNYPYLDQYLNPGSSCSQTLSASSVSVAAEGGSASVSVSTTASCGWSAASEVDWITTSSAAIGSGTAQLVVSANTAGANRSGTVIVGKRTVTVTQPAATSSGAELLTNPGFESGTTGWVQSPTDIITTVAQSGAGARSGSGLAWLSGYNNANDQLYQQVAIPADASSAVFSFWYRIATEDLPAGDFDRLVVSVDNASGTTVGSVVTLSNRSSATGWTQSALYDLSAFRGQTVRIAFRATSDANLITSFFIDDVSVAITRSASAFQATGLWYNFPAESEAGWGINFTQQGDIVFGTLFTYDTDGSPLWLVMSRGDRQGTADTFSGPLYRTTGPAFNSVPFRPIRPENLTQVGTMTVAFQPNGTAQLNYTVNGAPVAKTITRQVFGNQAATCTNTTGSRAGLTNYQDLWYAAPAESEAGWGINFTQQRRGAEDIIFATLFTYDATGRGLWLVMSEGIRQSDGSFVGSLFRTTGPAFNAVPFTPIGPGNLTPVGTMRLAFSNGETGTLSYTVNGVQVNKNITRQVFSSPLPACN